ncbi:MAG: MotE family protein [bacterium]
MDLLRSERGQGALVTFLLIVLLGLIGGGMWMIDRLGLVDVQSKAYSAVEPIPYVGDYVSPGPLSKEDYQSERLRRLENQLQKQKERLDKRKKSLKKRARQLKEKQKDLQRRKQQLASRERALLDRRSEHGSRDERYQYLANLYGSMRPADAAERLQNIKRDPVVISILQKMENGAASIILSNMEADRASVLTRKMAQYPTR